jgi:PAS domain S-box-containing protein
VSYFQDFYRDIRVNPGTKVTLLHRNGPLLARYPPVEGSLGKRYPAIDATLAARGAGDAGPLRLRSPVDDVERFAAVRAVPDYPLAVVVSRDVQTALAEWRAQATGTALRTLALGLLAVLLLAVLARQLRRLDAAHESLKDSRERFALAVAGSDDGIWDWERDSDAIYASPRARELYGLPPGPETTSREAWHAQVQVHPDDVAPRLAAIDANMAGETPLYEFEYRVRHPDGRYRWVRARGLCVRDAAGVALRMAGSVSDIDTRRRTEEALRVSEERFALAVAGSDVGVWDWDLRAGMAFESARAREIQGLPPGPELQRLDDLVASLRVHPDDAPLRAERIRAHLAGETPAYEVDYRVRHDDGQYRWVRVRALCIRDAQDEPYRMAGSVVDIDAQRRAEEALRLSEERYAIAMTGSDEAHWVWNVKTDELFSSPQLHRLTGIDGRATGNAQRMEGTRADASRRPRKHAACGRPSPGRADAAPARRVPRRRSGRRRGALDLQPRPVLPRRRRPARPHGRLDAGRHRAQARRGGAARKRGAVRARGRGLQRRHPRLGHHQRPHVRLRARDAHRRSRLGRRRAHARRMAGAALHPSGRRAGRETDLSPPAAGPP